MNRVIRKAVVLTACALSTACTQAQIKPPGVETRTYVSSNCLLSENAAQAPSGLGAILAGVLLPKAIDYAVDYAVKELTKIRKEESKSSTDIYLYKHDMTVKKFPEWNPNFICMTTITAQFTKDATPSLIHPLWNYDTTVRLGEEKLADTLIMDRLEDNGINFHDDSWLSMYEAKIDFLEDQSAFKIKSQYLHINKLLKDKQKAGQVYTFEIAGPGASPDAEKYVVASLDFGEVVPGTIRNSGQFKGGKQTGLIKKPGMSQGSLITFISRRYDPDKIQGDTTARYTPVNLTVRNTQTRKPGDAAKLTAAILGALKETISSSVTDALVPTSNADERSKILDAEIALKTADVTVETAAAGTSQAAVDLSALQREKACRALNEFNAALCTL